MTDAELKELVGSLAIAQRKTDIQMAKTDIQMAKTDKKLAELAERHEKREAQWDEKWNAKMAEIDERHEKREAQWDEKWNAKMVELAEQHEKTEAGQQELQKAISQLSRRLGDMGNIQGDIAEDLFRRNVARLLKERGVLVKNVGFQVSMPGTAEYDIVAENAQEVVVLEVKNKMTLRLFRRFLERQLPRFKREFPIYADHKIYGAIGSLIVPEKLEQEAAENGLFIFTQSQDGGASIANPPNFQAKVW